MTVEEEIALLVTVLKEHIAHPRKAVVNSESSFVSDALYRHNPDLSRRYWSWVCNSYRKSDLFGKEVESLQETLFGIDLNYNRLDSSWTRGT